MYGIHAYMHTHVCVCFPISLKQCIHAVMQTYNSHAYVHNSIAAMFFLENAFLPFCFSFDSFLLPPVSTVFTPTSPSFHSYDPISPPPPPIIMHCSIILLLNKSHVIDYCENALQILEQSLQ